MSRFLSAIHCLRLLFCVCLVGLGSRVANAADGAPSGIRCTDDNTVRADVVALNQVVFVNRLGTVRPGGEIYALRRDVVSTEPNDPTLRAGKVRLHDQKRPRPIVLRARAGDCLRIRFENLLYRDPIDPDPIAPVTTTASIHVTGMQLVESVADAGSWVGANTRSLADPEQPVREYLIYAEREGSYLLYSTSADFNGFGTNQLTMGLFGAVNVEPARAEVYRSQVTRQDLLLAGKKATGGALLRTPAGQPELDYSALYPADFDDPGNKYLPHLPGRACTPILRMVDHPRVRAGDKCVFVKGSENQWVTFFSDLTAMVTGPNHGRFNDPGNPSFAPNSAEPDRSQPFREITIHYHESQDVVQAFRQFYDFDTDPASHGPLNYALSTGADGFAINYGIGGIAGEILSNRLGVGPSKDCVECKYEEFFLSSWALGDPALLVDRPANFPITGGMNGDSRSRASIEQSAAQGVDCKDVKMPDGKPPSCPPLDTASKATRAFYPDDPSNVYHSYLGDHVIFRVLHAGNSVNHVHHHHAHQWLRSPNSPDGHYLDSQAIGPGSSFSMDLVYAGAGNRNLSPGDSIFHCHFYPHFAAGMWALFRVHDVFEDGTALDRGGIPLANARALPDGEIAAGTPIPAVVPLPTKAMPMMPAAVTIKNGQLASVGKGNPGYPFFVPGLAGHRAPHPPMDFATDEKGVSLDGGLPRHLITGGKQGFERHTNYDYTKESSSLTALVLPEGGTPVERAAMAEYSQRRHPSFTPEGKPDVFLMNGGPAVPGAPFANPGIDDNGQPIKGLRRYRGADIQTDVVLNRQGWHFPQQRILSLWEDVKPTLDGSRPPEPLFFRANSGDVIEYWHTNLVPSYYEMDDFQVRTPTDILGQHIHLVKFDVLASDGAANGFNYEDGTFSPDEVRDRIEKVQASGGRYQEGAGPLGTTPGRPLPAPKARSIEFFGDGPSGKWVGAQTTVQRWWADPLIGPDGDRSIGTVFTHDHFGPSTHQQAGLYGALVIEPAGSTWRSSNTDQQMGTRRDGGPTSFAANIITANPANSFREFGLEWQDTQLAYSENSRTRPDCYGPEAVPPVDCAKHPASSECALGCVTSKSYQGWAQPSTALGPPLLKGSIGPQPLLYSAFGQGVFSLNYRAESLAQRVARGAATPGDQNNPAFDLSQAFRSIKRPGAAYQQQPESRPKNADGRVQIDASCDPKKDPCFSYPKTPLGPGMQDYDPYTPLLRAYQGDNVQIRVLAGAHTTMHDFTLNGVKWLSEPFNSASGYRNSQMVLLSEHFEMLFTAPPATPNPGADGKPKPYVDHLYVPGSSFEGLVNGLWGLMRVFDGRQAHPADLKPLPNNPAGHLPGAPVVFAPPSGMRACGAQFTDQLGVPCVRTINLSVASIGQLTGGGALVLNGRGITLRPDTGTQGPPIANPDALLYVRDEDLDAQGRLKPGVPIEPLVLHVGAGDWLKVRLRNRLTGREKVLQQAQPANRYGQTGYGTPYKSINLFASPQVGLHPQLLAYDPTNSDGNNAGDNPLQTVAPGKTGEYLWYAGSIRVKPDGALESTPAEFGALNLMPSDRLQHPFEGLFAAMVVEPEGSRWVEDPESRASVTVWKKDGTVFRDFAVIEQNDIAASLGVVDLYPQGLSPSGFNYRTEPMFYRFGQNLAQSMTQPPANWTQLSSTDIGNLGTVSWANVETSRNASNRLTGDKDFETPVFRAPARMPVRFRLFGAGGIGDNQQVFELDGHVWEEEPYNPGSTVITHNPRSGATGTTPLYGPTSHYNLVIEHAGGANGVPGDYLYRSWVADQFQVGLLGVFRVVPNANRGSYPDTVNISSVVADNGKYTVRGSVTVNPASPADHPTYARSVTLNGQDVVVDHGYWVFSGKGKQPVSITVSSPLGGVASWPPSAVLRRPGEPSLAEEKQAASGSRAPRTQTLRTGMPRRPKKAPR